MPRPKKNPNAVVFEFALNPEKTLATSTLSNYKGALNRLAEFSAFENERDKTKPLIKTKADLLNHPEHTIALIKEHISARLTKSATLAAIFYSIGRQDENHPYVKEFRTLYYTDKYPQKKEGDVKLIESAKDE
jgi:hypothetical protein